MIEGRNLPNSFTLADYKISADDVSSCLFRRGDFGIAHCQSGAFSGIAVLVLLPPILIMDQIIKCELILNT